jgi:transcriptional regulator with XRE-family HTH domain
MGPDDAALAAARVRLADRMRQLRTEANMSQRQAADLAGMDQKNWSRIEGRRANPRLDSLLRIQFALRLESIESLFGSPGTGELLQRKP